MSRKQAMEIKLSENQLKILTQLKKGTHSQLHLKQRSEIIMLAYEGHSNNEIERKMGIHGETVTKWRNRYVAAYREIVSTETDIPRKLREKIETVLSDEPRSGKPPTFKDEQVACIIALSCEQPDRLGLPFSHWTPELLKQEAIKRGIVDSISAMQISRFLKKKEN